ncbi:glutathione peroxidase [Pelistega suis]|uniref:Glutathione peroxidase n=1 Tax=Pelistega suis TaxID=1631957 RepID=A0A849P6Q6_9BURK|nr:glutathione peroxidase [Pelistega suis]NOL51435.1 glutathione peroxidase [Pelistega suis]
MSIFYTFSAQQNNGETLHFYDLQEKVVLIVNVASKCGFTPQYKELEQLYQQFKDKNFTILAFPCNQFGQQEPGTAEEIRSFCELNYGVTFPLMAKIDVNGANEHPLYHWLKQEKKGLLGGSIKWNFTKFLINQKGEVVDRFAPTTSPSKLQDKIIQVIEYS